ncbi:polycystin-1-like protein 2 [Branchiostoma floridae x Branchiostoma belcheri]
MERKACPELPILNNGNKTEGHLYGDTVTFSCDEGYELIGSENRTCQANQSWSGAQTNCSRKACPELPLPDHATRTEGHLYGDTVTFSCNEGYELIGSENRTCQANQSWSGVQTNCSKKACSELPLPNHATRTEGHLYGNTVTFSCNEGYELIGSENRTCQANQTWSGVQPNCNSVNVALGKAAFQTSDYEDQSSGRGAARFAVNGNTNSNYHAWYCTHTALEADPSWWVDLGQSYMIDRVAIFNRQDCCAERLNPFNIHIGDSDQVSENPKCGGDHQIALDQPSISVSCQGMRGRYVGVRLPGPSRILTLCQVQVFSDVDYCRPDPCVNGTCTSGADNYTCACDEGYEGETCEVPITGIWLRRDSSWVVDSTGTPFVDNGVTYDAAKALDGNTSTYWNVIDTGQNHSNWYIVLDIAAPQNLTRIAVNSYGDTTHDIAAFTLQKSQVGSPYSWEDVVSVDNVQGGTDQRQEFSGFQGTARYWRFVVTRTHEGWQPYLTELNLYSISPVNSLTLRTSNTSVYDASEDFLTVEIFSDLCDDVCTNTTVSGLTDVGTEYDRTFAAPNFGHPTRLRLTISGEDWLKLNWVDVYNVYTGLHYRFSWPSKGYRLSTDPSEGSPQVVVDVDGKVCPELPLLNNGNRTEGHLYGDTVIFSCDKGYELIGSENRTCQADQTWSGVQPNCNRKACPQLPILNNGNRTEGHLYGNTVTFSCNEGYELIGSENRTCQADQSWSGVQPNCNKKLCQQLMAPSNGNISGNSSYGDVVTYHCDPGYEISGDKQRTCQSDQTWSATEPTCVDCVPDISLSGGGSSESSAVKIARRTAFTIRSRINVICNQTYRVTYEWNIFQHDPMGNVVQLLDFPNKVVRDSQDITIPRNSLGYGSTIVELNATMDFPTTGSKKSQVQKQWVIITPSAPVAHIAGGSAKSVSRDGVLVLNASESYDPDEYIDDLRNFTFHWTCQTINGTSCNGIFPDARQSDAEYELQTASFSNGVDTVTFTVEVGLPGRNSSRTSQSVTLLGGVVLNIAIRCAANCETKVSPSERLVLVTQCDDCPTANTTYLWTLTGDKHIDWDVDTTTGNTSPNLVVRSNIFEAGESYTFRITVTSNVAPGGTGFSEHSFRVNTPPTVGFCAVSPSSGFSTITQFGIWCEGADDDDVPLVYSLYFNNDVGDHAYTLLHKGTTEQFLPQLLPAGQEHRDFNVTLEVRVSDALGATSIIRNIKVQVRQPSVEDTEAKLSSLNDTLENLLDTGDNRALLQLTNSLSSVLNAANTSSYSDDTLSKARDGLINSMTRIPVQSLDNVDQVAGALGLATALEEQVTPQSQESAAKTVLQMSNFLDTPEREDVGPERLEETASVLLRACVNILRASTASATKSKELPSSETRGLHLDKNKIATQTTFDAIGKLNVAVLDQKVPGESPTTFSVGEFNLAVEKQRCDSTNGQPQVFRANGQLGSSTFFVVPSLSGLLGDSCETKEDVGIENFKTPRNPYAFATTSEDVKTEVGGLQFLRNGRPLVIRDLTDPVEVFTQRLSESSQNGRIMTELGMTAPSWSKAISTHQFNMTEGRSLHLTVTPHLVNVSVRLYLKRGDEPRRIDEFDRNTTLPLSDDADLFTLSLGTTETMTADRWTWFIPGNDVDSTEPIEYTHYLGVEHVPHTEQGDVSPSVSPEDRGENFTLNYTLQIYSTQCLYFNEEREDFESDGCQPGPLSSAALSHCRCNHLTAFGSSFTFFVAPNKLNILEALQTLNIRENPVVVIAVSVLFGIYILVVIWARRKDTQDSKKVGATILRGDQGRFHDHFYQITVLTGSRSESSTSARVFMTLMGEGGTSGPHELEDRDRVIFREGGVDTFILPTSRHLGSLYAVHVWHDNTGPCPSWFLDKIILQDLSDDKKYSFLCQRWLAVEEGDGRVDCLLSSATDEQLSTLRHVFGSRTSKAFNDGHLWASVLGRPAYSPFTRVQRVSCCMSLLLCTMVTNIAFFQRENDFSKPPPIDILGFKLQIPISWAQFMIALESCLIIFPINLAIVEIFRHVSSPPERKDKDQRGSSASSMTSDSDFVSLEEIELQKIDKAWDFYRQPYSDSKMADDKKKGCILPWWCVYIAWFLVFASCFLSAFFTILYGQAYGREKAEEWLFVFFTSFFADLFVLQPVKVVLLAVGLTLVLRKPHDDAENQTPTLEYEEVCAYLSTIKATPAKECHDGPPDSTKLAEMRVRRFVEISMKKAMYEFAFYFLFVLVLVVIANGPRDTGMFHMTQHLRKTVDDGGDHSFTKVDDAESFWNFVRYTLSPALYGNRWYNDDNREPDGFMADKTSYVVGPVRIRQLRVAEDPSCKRAWQVQHIFKDCTNAYSQLSHDSNSYGMGWSETPDDNSSLLVQNNTNPWVYRHSPDVPVVGTHATYWDGGYFVTVTNTTPAAVLATVSQLEPRGWIDRYTRAVFVEMTVYNPHANLFSVVSLLTEFTAMGKAYPRVDITTVRLYRFQTTWAWVVVGFQGVFIIFTLYFVFREFELILKLRSLYLKTFWGCVELGLALLPLAEVGVMLYTLYIVLDFQSKPGTNKEPAERPFEKYRRAAYWDQINTYVLGCLVCVGTLKLLHLLRFNKHVVLGADTMKKAAGTLSGFFLIFTIVFVAYATFAFLVFGPTEEGFSPFVATVESMFTILLGKFYELSDAKTVMGPLFTFTFITFFQWVILIMVVAILDGAIHEVAEQNSQQKPETEQVADLMLERLHSWVGGLLQRAGNGRSSSASQEDYNPTEEELTDFLTNADFVRLQGRQESSSTTIEFCIEN